MPPYFCADYVDTWLDDVARKINRIKYLPNVITEHMHFSVNKSKYDENTEKRLENLKKENPGKIYYDKENERIEHAYKLIQYIESLT